MLGITIFFLEKITSAVTQSLCKSLTIIPRHERRPREDSIFHVHSMAAGRGMTIDFHLSFSLKKKTFFETELVKTKETDMDAES